VFRLDELDKELDNELDKELDKVVDKVRWGADRSRIAWAVDRSSRFLQAR